MDFKILKFPKGLKIKTSSKLKWKNSITKQTSYQNYMKPQIKTSPKWNWKHRKIEKTLLVCK